MIQSDIKIESYNQEKICAMIYTSIDGTKLSISVDSFFLNNNNDQNPGLFFEKYRQMQERMNSPSYHDRNTSLQLICKFNHTTYKEPENANEYFDKYKKEIISQIDSLDFKKDYTLPDYIQIIDTCDKNRFEIIKYFGMRIIKIKFKSKKISIPDYSSHFYKNNKYSVKNTSLSFNAKKKYFSYVMPNQISKPVKCLWFIDDTIDEGITLRIFLDKLFDNKIINEATKIHCFILYNNQNRKTLALKDCLNNMRNNVAPSDLYSGGGMVDKDILSKKR